MMQVTYVATWPGDFFEADSLLILTVLSHSLVSRSSYLTACKDEMLNRMQHVEGCMLMPSYSRKMSGLLIFFKRTEPKPDKTELVYDLPCMFTIMR